jgi:hypothetical protein
MHANLRTPTTPRSATTRTRSPGRRSVVVALLTAALLASCTVKVGDTGSDDTKSTTTTSASDSSGLTQGATTADITGLAIPGFTLTLDAERTDELKANESIGQVANDVQVNSVGKDGETVGGIITLALKTKDVDEDTVRQYAEGVAGDTGKVDELGRNGNVIVAIVSSDNGLSHTIYITDDSGLLVDVYSRDATTTQQIVEAIASGG